MSQSGATATRGRRGSAALALLLALAALCVGLPFALPLLGSSSSPPHKPRAAAAAPALAGDRPAAASRLLDRVRGARSSGGASGLAARAALPTMMVVPGLAPLTLRWLMEGAVGVGCVRLGLPGLVSLAMFLNPLLEVVPKIWRERGIGELPMLPYSSMVAAGLVWSTYGVLVGAPTVAVVNIASVVLGALYCAVYLRFCPRPADNKAHLSGVALVACWCAIMARLPRGAGLLGLGLTGDLLCMILFGSPLACVRKVLAEASTRSLPFGFTCIVTLNSFVWLVYAVSLLHDPLVMLPNAVGLLLGLAQLSLFARFGIQSA